MKFVMIGKRGLPRNSRGSRRYRALLKVWRGKTNAKRNKKGGVYEADVC